MGKILPVVFVSFGILAGCQGRPEVDPTDDEAKTKTTPKAKKKIDSAPARVERSSMEGNWVAQVSYQIPELQGFGYLSRFLVKISKEKSGKYEATLLEVPPNVKGTIKTAEISERAAHLVFSVENEDYDFRVTLDKTDAPGNLVLGRTLFVLPARFLATSESTLARFLKPALHERNAEFTGVLSQIGRDEGTERLKELVKKYPRNPLVFYATLRLDPLQSVDSPESLRPAPSALREHLTRLNHLASRWGKRMSLTTRLDFARSLGHWQSRQSGLIRLAVNPSLGLEILRDLQRPKSMGLLTEPQKSSLVQIKRLLELEQNAEIILTEKDAGKRDEAIRQIKKRIGTEFVYSPWLIYVLAEGAQKAGRLDDAVRHLATLLVVPAMTLDLKTEAAARWRKTPGIRKTVKKIWTDKNGDTKGLDEYLSQAYRSRLSRLRRDVIATKPKPLRKRTHVCELFTSCDDLRCIGADVAATILQRSFNPVDLIVLRYHLDVPGPNPLVCNDSKFLGFNVGQPPFLLVNGKPLLGVRIAGTIPYVPYVMYEVRRRIRQEPAAGIPHYAIKLSASAKNGIVQIQADVDAPEEKNPDLRLRLVLAEDRIVYTGKNGIRFHEMVVRSLPVGPEGVPLNGKKTHLKKPVDLKKLSEALRDFLKSLEEKKNMKLRIKPVEFKKLHVVAVVQSKKNGTILQAASVVVDGLSAASRTPRKKTKAEKAPAGKKAAVQAAKPRLKT